MLKELGELHRGAARYALLCPLLFMVPVVAEFVQHVGEVRVGMYESFAAAEAVAAHPLRMGLGFMKTISLLLATYWVLRFFGIGPGAAMGADRRAVRLFAPVFAWSLAWGAAGLWGGNLLGALGVPDAALTRIGVTVFLVMFLFELTLSPWKAATAVGDGRIGFLRSVRLAHGDWWWALGFTLLAVLPPMIVHYAFGLGAIGRSEGVVWIMLALDSLFVGYLAAVLAGTNFIIARRMLARAGLRLEPVAGGAPQASRAATA